MSRFFNNALRQVRLIIYKLKRNYGLPVTIVEPVKETHNVQTGAISRTFNKIEIERAIVLPTKDIRSFVYDLTFIAANNNFTSGAFFDRSDRIVIIDAQDVPSTYEPNSDHHLEFNGQRWEINVVERAEDRRGYILGVRSLSNSSVVA